MSWMRPFLRKKDTRRPRISLRTASTKSLDEMLESCCHSWFGCRETTRANTGVRIKPRYQKLCYVKRFVIAPATTNHSYHLWDINLP
jgi:hypothetical protein